MLNKAGNLIAVYVVWSNTSADEAQVTGNVYQETGLPLSPDLGMRAGAPVRELGAGARAAYGPA